MAEKKSTYERFMSKVKVSDTGCWEWQAAKFTNGYGAFHVRPKQWRAHRWSYQHHHGEIPEGLCVLHSCDNPVCVNPEHLSAGTLKDNTEDMFKKGRANKAKGSKHGAAILSESDVLLIKGLLERHPPSVASDQMGYGVCRFLGRWFGVNFNTICNIKSGKHWA